MDYRKGFYYARAHLANPNVGYGYRLAHTTSMARAYTHLGDFDAAEKLLRQADDLLADGRNRPAWSYWEDYGPGYRSSVDRAWAYYLHGRGKLAEAEQRYRRAIAASEEDLALQPARVSRNLSTRPEEAIIATREDETRLLADTLRDMGRLEEAEVVLRELLQSTLTRLGAGRCESRGSCFHFRI